MRFLVLILLLLSLSSVSAAPVPKNKKLPLAEQILGAWAVESRETDGGKNKDNEGTTWTISEGQLVSNRGGTPNTWVLTLDTEADPAKYQLTIGGSGYTGIMEIDGDTLRVCHTMVGIRPKEFSTKEGAEIVILKRTTRP